MAAAVLEPTLINAKDPSCQKQDTSHGARIIHTPFKIPARWRENQAPHPEQGAQQEGEGSADEISRSKPAGLFSWFASGGFCWFASHQEKQTSHQEPPRKDSHFFPK